MSHAGLMDDYRRYVETMARIADGKDIILNRTPAHASVIVSVVFDKAQQYVEILAGQLRDDIYGTEEVVRAATRFLDRCATGQIDIIVSTPVSAQNRMLLRALAETNHAERVSLQLAAPVAPYQYRFIISDGMHYRFQGESAKPEAIVQFGNKENSKKLHDIFSAARDRSQPLPLAG